MLCQNNIDTNNLCSLILQYVIINWKKHYLNQLIITINTMNKNITKSAFIIIDMQRGFTDAGSPLCIAGAASTVSAISAAAETARSKGIPVFFVKRAYRADGSDVENTRYKCWKTAENVLAPGSSGPFSAEEPEGLEIQPGDYTIIKPRFSAFFQTELDLILRRLGVRNIILAGTTTPNCIRTTAYDGISLDYNVIIIEDCCSSQTDAIQHANVEDMVRAGVTAISSAEFKNYDENTVTDLSAMIRSENF